MKQVEHQQKTQNWFDAHPCPRMQNQNREKTEKPGDKYFSLASSICTNRNWEDEVAMGSCMMYTYVIVSRLVVLLHARPDENDEKHFWDVSGLLQKYACKRSIELYRYRKDPTL